MRELNRLGDIKHPVEFFPEGGDPEELRRLIWPRHRSILKLLASPKATEQAGDNISIIWSPRKGFLTFRPRMDGFNHILFVAVAPPFRHQGVATALIQSVPFPKCASLKPTDPVKLFLKAGLTPTYVSSYTLTAKTITRTFFTQTLNPHCPICQQILNSQTRPAPNPITNRPSDLFTLAHCPDCNANCAAFLRYHGTPERTLQTLSSQTAKLLNLNPQNLKTCFNHIHFSL